MKNKTDAEMIELLRMEIAVHGSLRKWAKANGFSPSFVSDVLAGTRNVTERLAGALGFELVATWKRVARH